MKIKLSKSQWEFMGKKAGWMKKASKSANMRKAQYQRPSRETSCTKCHTQFETQDQDDGTTLCPMCKVELSAKHNGFDFIKESPTTARIEIPSDKAKGLLDL